ncbi:MAG: hypothetical protein HWD61_11970 [Parachlamydiaceae bacterium]|nr:MAG: hypothetical protein HWD61_11970 [Parachlamydiaceae bacterium]
MPLEDSKSLDPKRIDKIWDELKEEIENELKSYLIIPPSDLASGIEKIN